MMKKMDQDDWTDMPSDWMSVKALKPRTHLKVF